MKFTQKTWTKVSAFVFPKNTQSKDSGASFVEYGALIIFVGVVGALLVGSGIADQIVQGIGTAVGNALNPQGAGGGGGGSWLEDVNPFN